MTDLRVGWLTRSPAKVRQQNQARARAWRICRFAGERGPTLGPEKRGEGQSKNPWSALLNGAMLAQSNGHGNDSTRFDRFDTIRHDSDSVVPSAHAGGGEEDYLGLGLEIIGTRQRQPRRSSRDRTTAKHADLWKRAMHGTGRTADLVRLLYKAVVNIIGEN